MPDPSRKKETPAERAERLEIVKSLKTSTYLTDSFWENIHSGAKQKFHVPNYKKGVNLEGKAEHMDLEGFYKTASNNMTHEELDAAMQDVHVPREGDDPTFTGHPLPAQSQSAQNKFRVSPNQASAIKKYPILVEFLGKPGGEKIAKKINSEMNLIMADLVHENSKEANEYAVLCKADKQNLREYFIGNGWACRVTASGPFRGDEVIYYSRKKDLACVLRKSNVDGEIHYADVSAQFNVIYEAEEGDIPVEVVKQSKVETSVEETISTEGEENEVNEESQEIVADLVAEGTTKSVT